MVSRFSLCFELETFSLTRAADLFVQYTERLLRHAQRAAGAIVDRDARLVQLGDLFLQLRALVSCASPILIDHAASTAQAGGFPLSMSCDAYDVTSTTAFAVPALESCTVQASDADLLSIAPSQV
jgi:methionyl-tRNA synthetase